MGSPPDVVHVFGCGYSGPFEVGDHDQNENQGRKSPSGYETQVDLIEQALEMAGLSAADAESKAPEVLEALSDLLHGEEAA